MLSHSGSGRATKSLPNWVRWLLVLPASIAGSLAAFLLVSLLHFLDDAPRMFDFQKQMTLVLRTAALYWAFSYGFVWSGVQVAPLAKKSTGITLAVSLGLFMGIVVGAGLMTKEAQLSTWFFIKTGAFVLGAVGAAYGAHDEEATQIADKRLYVEDDKD